MNAVQKLRQLVGEIRTAPGAAQAKDAWALAERLLGRAPVDGAAVGRVCAARDIDGLDGLVAALESPAHAAPAVESTGPDVSAEEMDKALRAFRKRLKVMQLEEESRLGGRQLTGGKKSQIHAILPPHEFPEEVWKALARAGKLKAEGRGFYSLARGGG